MNRFLARNRFIILGAALFFAPLVTAIIDRTLVSPSCRVRDVGEFIMSGSERKLPDACDSVPLAIDGPSLVIWASCWGSVLIYSRLTRQLERLNDDLATNGLITSGKSVTTIELPSRDEFPQLKVRSFRWVLVIALLLPIGIYFHRFIRDHSPYFDFLETASSSHSHEDFARGWWAASGPGAWVWIGVGVIGAYFAVQHMVINFRFTADLRRRTSKVIPIPRSHYLANWEAPDHGWAPFESILLTIALGIFNFALAFGAIIYLLITRTSHSGLTLLALAAATSGVIANYWAAMSVVRYIRDSFDAARRRYADKLRDQVDSLQAPAAGRAAVIIEQMHLLNEVGGFPLKGFWRHAMPVGIALFGQLALIVATIRWLLTG